MIKTLHNTIKRDITHQYKKKYPVFKKKKMDG